MKLRYYIFVVSLVFGFFNQVKPQIILIKNSDERKVTYLKENYSEIRKNNPQFGLNRCIFNYKNNEIGEKFIDSLLIYYAGKSKPDNLKFYYNQKGKIYEIIWFDNLSENSKLFLRIRYYYTKDGLVKKILYDLYNNGDWVPDFETNFFYDENQLVNEEIVKINFGTGLIPVEKVIYNYSEKSYLESYIVQNWNESSWINSEKTSFDYSKDRLIGELSFSFSNNFWWEYSIVLFNYDGNELSEILFSRKNELKWQTFAATYFEYNYLTDINSVVLNSNIIENNRIISKNRTEYQYDKSNYFLSGSFKEKYYNHYVNSIGIISINNPDGFEMHFLATEIRTFYKSSMTSVSENNDVATGFSLSQNYPNPFNPTTTIEFSIPDVGTGLALSVLKVYDMLGREVATLVNEQKSPGNYEVKFDGNNLASGVYFYQLRAGEFSQTKKMILMR
ncbi:MAG: hypothetical protein Fur0015_08800 [Ignavibacteriales bacterium]